MKASKFTEAQKAFILKQGEQGTRVAEICGKAGISQATYFNWKKKCGGPLPDEMRRLKALEDKNTRLKKIVTDMTLDREMLQDVIRRKLRSMAVCARSSPGCASIGACRSGRPMGPSVSTHPLTTTSPGGRIRLPSRGGSGRSRRRVCAMATGAFKCCCVARDG